ncbi:hypothetical protein ElyMa_005221200 [Elysia marginata]|uniref:Uncharacterized protein n=1 Tax=Elysia marginata TaxID=1093978 RepID=A0AAV4JV16_9GAST|nr:hypothetical protein ElyMa_005221200 [Elysia marginata]
MQSLPWNLLKITKIKTYLYKLLTDIEELSPQTVLRWILGHCPILGNELAIKWSSMTQDNTVMSLKKAKTQIRTAVGIRWTNQHPSFNANDPYHKLNREKQLSSGSEQDTTGYGNLFTKLEISKTPTY